jgi:hypothetical protein
MAAQDGHVDLPAGVPVSLRADLENLPCVISRDSDGPQPVGGKRLTIAGM